MANPDIPAGLTVLETHLTNSGAALTIPIQDVARGFPTGAGQIRYYWSGECPPPHMSEANVLNGKMVGQRFTIVVTWMASDLNPATIAILDAEMKTFAVELRTRLQADNDLGDHIESLDLQYGEPDLVIISGIRIIAMKWELDLGYEEYPVAK